MSERQGKLWLPQLREVDGGPAPLEGRFFEGDDLSAPELRIALVETVDRLNPHGLNEGLLLCDRAAAYLSAGQREYASELLDRPEARSAIVRLAETALGVAELDTANLATHITSVRLSPGLEDLVDLVTLGEEILGGHEFSSLAAELRIELRMRRRGTLAALSTPLSRWIEVPKIGNYKAPAVLLRQRVDLRAVPSRLIRWNGAEAAEIEAQSERDGTIVRIPLRRAPETVEVLRLFAADPDGHLIAGADLSVTGNQLVGRLERLPVPLARIYLGVYSGGLDGGVLARRAAGPAVDAERLLIQSWTSARFGLAAAVAIEAERATKRRGSEVGDDPLLVRPWLQEAPTARASSATAHNTALSAGGGDRQVLPDTYRTYDDRRAWDLRTTIAGPGRPLLSELAHVVESGSGT